MHAGERLNGYSHLTGALLTVPAAALLLARLPRDDLAAIAGVAVFALSALALYVASTMCHGSRDGAARRWWERADHCAIHGLIAGTYTPFALALLNGGRLWLLLGGIWAVALAGMVHEWRAGAPGRPAARRSSVARYVAAGWLAVVAAAPIAAQLRGTSLAWLLGGAAFYTAGTYFYWNPRRLRHGHGTWHLFVLAGTACHYLSIAALLDGGGA